MRFSMIFLAATLSLAAIGCGRKDHYVVQVHEVSVPAPTPTEQDNIDAVVKEVNELRFNQGQNLIQPGLICNVYTGLSSTPYPYNAAATSVGSSKGAWTYVGSIWQEDSPTSNGLNMMPYALRIQPLYKEYYAMSCSGQLVVTKSDYYSVTLRSDDSGQVLIGGTMVIDNGGHHGPTPVSGSKFLAKGIHSITLRYYQLNGTQSLQLSIPGQYLYH